MMTVEELCTNGHVSISTLKGKWRHIPGVCYKNKVWIIDDGTRYPYDMRKIPRNSKDKRKCILQAIYNYKYIDNKMLGIPIQSFELLVNDLLNKDLIRENGTNNPYGVNRYDTTPIGEQLVIEEKWEELEKAVILSSEAVGTALGSFTSKANS